MGAVVKDTPLILAGGKEEAEELQRQFFAYDPAGWESTLFDNSRSVLDKTERNSDARHTVKAVFAQSLGNGAIEVNGLGREKAPGMRADPGPECPRSRGLNSGLEYRFEAGVSTHS